MLEFTGNTDYYNYIKSNLLNLLLYYISSSIESFRKIFLKIGTVNIFAFLYKIKAMSLFKKIIKETIVLFTDFLNYKFKLSSNIPKIIK